MPDIIYTDVEGKGGRMNKHCKGCPTYLSKIGEKSLECLLSFFSENAECPCTSCLVKPVCTKSCDDLEYFSTHVRVQHHEKYDKMVERRRNNAI